MSIISGLCRPAENLNFHSFVNTAHFFRILFRITELFEFDIPTALWP
jgi:hypothetical protein